MANIINFNMVKIFSLPIILYVLLITIRILGHQPSMEGQLGDFITALNFLFGSFVSYFVFVFYVLNTKTLTKAKVLWWWIMCILLAVLAFDELFMIHENIGYFFDTNGTLVFVFYGISLGALLAFDLNATFRKDTLSLLVLFSFFAILSQGADYFYGEGVVVIMGRDISYEQFAESFGALCLSCAIATIAIRQLSNDKFNVNTAC
jgi:hypothetical protein